MPARPRIGDVIVEELAAEARLRMVAASAILHPGERGRAREDALRRFLRAIVPTGFEVDTGFVIDSQGGQSKQQDILVIRRDYHPVFRLSGAHFYPVEAVAAAIEVKSSLDSRTLTDALQNNISVKALDRTGGGTNYRVIGSAGGLRSEPVEPEDHNWQVFTMVVAASAVTASSTLVDTFSNVMTERPRREWTNMVVVAGEWSLTYESEDVRTNQMAATGLRVADSDHPDNVDALIDAAEQLWSFLRVAILIDVQPAKYVTGSWYRTASYPLPGATSP